MSRRSLNEIVIKFPTELFDFIFAAYNLRFILPLVVNICTQRHDARRIQQRYFICCSIFVIPALRKRRVQGHYAVYHFRIYFNAIYYAINLTISSCLAPQLQEMDILGRYMIL